MKKYLKKYYEIMEDFHAGRFGDDHLTLHDIFEKAGEPELLVNMSLSEIQSLVDSSSGMLKSMFSTIKNRKIKAVERTKRLEEELAKLNINDYCDGENISLPVLAKNLGLNVQYCDASELPEDVEATLSPTTSDEYHGVIKILEILDSSFSYMHEIIHYLKDVGAGNRVQKVYARKKQGKTDSSEEQDVNYLTAAASMPYSQISQLLDEFENADSEEEKALLNRMSEKYEVKTEAVLRRFIEVRNLVDYQKMTA